MSSRRDFLKTMTVLTGLPAVPAFARGRAPYNPAGKFEIKISEVELRRTAAGRQHRDTT